MLNRAESHAVETKDDVLRYEDFGAIGDGVTDDSAAIRATHDEANRQGLKVVGTATKSYRIGIVEKPITVKTDTDWNGARIIFDDSIIADDSSYRSIWVFQVASDDINNGHEIKPDASFSIKKGQTNINYPLGRACMIKLENSNKTIYLRYGPNANKGTPLTEMILVDADGNVDPSTPIQYDYDTVTSMFVYSIDDAPISIGNGKIETRVYRPRDHKPDYENYYCYYKRGINILRSNATVYGIDHTIVGEELTTGVDHSGDGVIDIYGADRARGVPYAGTFCFDYCYGSKMIDSTVQGHQAYSFFQGVTHDQPGTTRNEMGSYSLNVHYSINFSFINIKQREDTAIGAVITNRTMYHGIMGSYFCRNMLLDKCYIDRFDSHQGLHNATIKNSTIGFSIHMIGGGTMHVENTERIAGPWFIGLRNDYNGIFDGDIVIRNCTAGDSVTELIHATWREFYNGLDNVMIRSIDIDGLMLRSDSFAIFHVNNATRDALKNKINPLITPTGVTVRNLRCAKGICKPATSYYDDAFADVRVDFQD